MESKVDNDGKINVFQLKVPLSLALGHYEKLTDTELHDHMTDLMAEIRRRRGAA